MKRRKPVYKNSTIRDELHFSVWRTGQINTVLTHRMFDALHFSNMDEADRVILEVRKALWKTTN